MPNRTARAAIGFLTCAAVWVAPAAAQQDDPKAMMQAMQEAATPGEPHQQLAVLVGTWDAETKFWMDPEGEPLVTQGTLEYEMMMDGRFLRERVSSNFMGQPFQGMGIYGYNNVTDRIEATWIDNLSTGVYTYSGSINEDGSEITLESEYVEPATGQVTKTWTVMRIAPDRLHYTSYEVADGEKIKRIEITAVRKGS